jgi:hypothetical protein
VASSFVTAPRPHPLLTRLCRRGLLRVLFSHIVRGEIDYSHRYASHPAGALRRPIGAVVVRVDGVDQAGRSHTQVLESLRVSCQDPALCLLAHARRRTHAHVLTLLPPPPLCARQHAAASRAEHLVFAVDFGEPDLPHREDPTPETAGSGSGWAAFHSTEPAASAPRATGAAVCALPSPASPATAAAPPPPVVVALSDVELDKLEAQIRHERARRRGAARHAAHADGGPDLLLAL